MDRLTAMGGIADRARMVTGDGATLLRRDEPRLRGMGTEHALALILLVVLAFLILTRTGFRGALGG